MLSKGGTRKVDDYTVEFHLDAANGSFPYLVSSDNYNAIILPADYAGDFEQSMIGDGPVQAREIYPARSARPSCATRNIGAARWRRNASRRRSMPTIQPQILALQGGQVDIIQQVPVLQASALLNDPNFDIISLPSTAHQQVHMSNDDGAVQGQAGAAGDRALPRSAEARAGPDEGPGQDRQRQPVLPASIPIDRHRACRSARRTSPRPRQLMDAAGMANGFETTLTTERYLEIPDYAVLIQNAVKEIGGKINLNVLDQGAYYGDAVYGKSPWLDSAMGITDYGHRGVPNVFLAAPLRSDGTWNAAHFKNKDYDELVTSYVRRLDLEAQQAAAGKIQRLLLDETPLIFSYFYDF